MNTIAELNQVTKALMAMAARRKATEVSPEIETTFEVADHVHERCRRLATRVPQ